MSDNPYYGLNAVLWRDMPQEELSQEQLELKKHMYDQMQPRRRKFIERIGYDNWNPFQEPKNPRKAITDAHGLTEEELIQQFIVENQVENPSHSFKQGLLEAARGIVYKDDKIQAKLAFSYWYYTKYKPFTE